MKLPKELTTVTPFSKYLTMFLFILFPFVGFYLGTKFQTIQKQTPVVTNVSNNLNDKEKGNQQEKLNQAALIKEFMKRTLDYKTTSTSASYSCYDDKSLPKNEKAMIISKNLSEQNRSIQNLCLRTINSYWIVESVITEPKNWNPKYQKKLEVAIYLFNPDNTYSTDVLLSEDESVGERFKLVDWLTNNDIIFSLLGFDYGRTKTYVTNLENKVYFEPRLIEYCTYGIGKGTSARYFSDCKRFSSDKNSLYLNEKDLP